MKYSWRPVISWSFFSPAMRSWLLFGTTVAKAVLVPIIAAADKMQMWFDSSLHQRYGRVCLLKAWYQIKLLLIQAPAAIISIHQHTYANTTGSTRSSPKSVHKPMTEDRVEPGSENLSDLLAARGTQRDWSTLAQMLVLTAIGALLMVFCVTFVNRFTAHRKEENVLEKAAIIAAHELAEITVQHNSFGNVGLCDLPADALSKRAGSKSRAISIDRLNETLSTDLEIANKLIILLFKSWSIPICRSPTSYSRSLRSACTWLLNRTHHKQTSPYRPVSSPQKSRTTMSSRTYTACSCKTDGLVMRRQ